MNSVMRADRWDSADAEQGETTRTQNTQDSEHQMRMPTNEPYLSFYRNERGTNITVVRSIIDTWQKIIVFG